MIRIIVPVLGVGLGAIAWVLLLPEPRKHGPEPVRPSPVVAATGAPPEPVPAAAPGEAGREIRVVYPGPDAGATVRKLADKVAAETGPAPAVKAVAPTPAAPPPSAVSTAPVPAQVASAASVPAATVSPEPPASAAPIVPAQSGSGQTVNINTASVDALNQLPGVGHIGRMIASHRPYRSIDELVSRRVLRKSVYDRIKDQIAAN